jgi:ribosomal protein L37AE/L43A
MSEASRQRRLHVDNRLAELRSKYGRDIEDQALPPWLDTLEGYQAAHATPDAAGPQQATDHQPPQNRVLSAFQAMSRLDEHAETPLFACPACGEESAKASTGLDYWRCTQCGAWGQASALVPSKPGRTEVWEREPL